MPSMIEIARDGGGARLEMGCARAMNLAACTDSRCAEIAAAYASWMATNAWALVP